MTESTGAGTIYRHILIPTDGSEIAQKAVMEGIGLAAAVGARVTILAVLEPFTSMGGRQHAFAGVPECVRKQALDYLDADARMALDRGLASAAVRQVSADTALVEAAPVHEAIMAEADTRAADLIVMGSHGRRGVAALVLGSVTQKVLAHGRVPVLVVR